MKEFWSLHSRQSHSRHDSGVTYHDTYVRAIEMASRLWRQGRQARKSLGLTVNASHERSRSRRRNALPRSKRVVEECYRGECNSPHRVIENMASSVERICRSGDDGMLACVTGIGPRLSERATRPIGAGGSPLTGDGWDILTG